MKSHAVLQARVCPQTHEIEAGNLHTISQNQTVFNFVGLFILPLEIGSANLLRVGAGGEAAAQDGRQLQLVLEGKSIDFSKVAFV
jgi:hypothetical protein